MNSNKNSTEVGVALPRLVRVTPYAQSWLATNQQLAGVVIQTLGARVLVMHEDGITVWYDPSLDIVEDDPEQCIMTTKSSLNTKISPLTHG